MKVMYATERLETVEVDASVWLRRYGWLRQNPAWETEAFLAGLSADEFDAAVDKAMADEAKYKAAA